LANQAYLGQENLQQQAAGQAAQNQSLGLNATLGAQGQLGTNQNNTAGQALAAQGLASNNLLTQQGNQLKGALEAPVIDQQQMSDLSTGLNAAGMTQQDAQNQINAQIQNWNYNQQLPFNMLGEYAGMVGGTGYGSSQTGTTTQPYYSNTAANVLAGLTGGTSLLANAPSAINSIGIAANAIGNLFPSDRRLKTDIHKIGKSDSGVPLYTFRYKTDAPDAPPRMGLMAQDVKKTRPDAVVTMPFGFAVNYDKALAR
jgi:hypothetical protein